MILSKLRWFCISAMRWRISVVDTEQLHAHGDGYGPSSFEDEKATNWIEWLRLWDTFSLLPDFVPPANQTCTWEKLDKGSELMTGENQDVPTKARREKLNQNYAFGITFPHTQSHPDYTPCLPHMNIQNSRVFCPDLELACRSNTSIVLLIPWPWLQLQLCMLECRSN